MQIGNSYIYNIGDTLMIAQNAYKSEVDDKWYRTDTSEDAYLIEMVSDATDTGYIRIARTDKGTGEITWTEISRINNDGTIILNAPAITPSVAPSSNQAKLYLDDFLGRLVAKLKKSSKTVNLMEGDQSSRVYFREDGTFPTDAVIGDILIKSASVGGMHGGSISVDGNTSETAIAVANTWYQMTYFDTDDFENGVDADHTNDHIEVAEDGVYFIIATCSIQSAAGTGAEFEGSIFKNNGATQLGNICWHRYMAGGGGDVGSTAMHGIAFLQANDTIELWVQNLNNTTNIIFTDATLSLFKIK